MDIDYISKNPIRWRHSWQAEARSLVTPFGKPGYSRLKTFFIDKLLKLTFQRLYLQLLLFYSIDISLNILRNVFPVVLHMIGCMQCLILKGKKV